MKKIISYLMFVLVMLSFQACVSTSAQYDPFKDPDYLDYLRHIHSIDDFAAQGQLSQAEAETRKYQAWDQYKAQQQKEKYLKKQICLQQQQLDAQKEVLKNQEAILRAKQSN
jgi:hypothetical protein